MRMVVDDGKAMVRCGSDGGRSGGDRDVRWGCGRRSCGERWRVSGFIGVMDLMGVERMEVEEREVGARWLWRRGCAVVGVLMGVMGSTGVMAATGAMGSAMVMAEAASAVMGGDGGAVMGGVSGGDWWLWQYSVGGGYGCDG
ncbi:hypothetical protein F0562_012744 [Nyssa sinensis]|uniref:Uncharacterized protein n=1 Tax=Nyssa sinensis TaxID=561372 RepID=A0A5J4ZX03_9ASTE|nr:hypothetical protein F0562_012744 [Nyssa sinensis]